MKINLKCFANLANDYECGYLAATPMELTGTRTVNEVMRASGIPEKEVKIIFVNGQLRDGSHPLSNGDSVALVPATGGM